MQLTPGQLASEVLNALKARYPAAPTLLRHNSPWELLVATVLAAQCADARVNQVTPLFFSRWPGPAELAKAPLAEVEDVVRSTGFFRNKAKNLVNAARMVVSEFGGALPASMEELTKLPGVARKTANVVLYAGFGVNAGLAVDTHVKRISGRLGLTQSADPVRIEQDLLKLFPQEEWGGVNHRMVWFGRDVCKARMPLCGSCELNGVCAHAAGAQSKGGAP